MWTKVLNKFLFFVQRLNAHHLLLIAGIAFGVTLLVWQALSVSTITYDDGISYLAATGHQGLYWTDKPTGQWVLASQWQSFWTPSEFGVFEKISHDLAFYDIHPPLYFWALHVWTSIMGVYLSTGPLLNIIFLIVAMIFIYLTSIELRCTPWSATIASLVWFLSGSTLSAGIVVRQYSLLGLAVAFYFFSLMKFLNAKQLVTSKSSVLANFYIFLAIVVGLLTHYQFILVVGFTSLFVIILLMRSENYIYGIKSIIIVSFLAAIVSVVLHPDFYHSLIRQQSQVEHFYWGSILWRLKKIIIALVEVFAPSYGYGLVFFILISSLIIIATCIRMIFFTKNADFFPELSVDKHYLPFASASLISLAVFALYIFGFSPSHAMSSIYIILLTPIYFIVIAQLLDFLVLRFKILAPIFLLGLLCWQATYGVYVAYRHSINEDKKHKIIKILKTNIPIVLDSVARGVLPTFIWHVNNATQVYAASQKEILNNLPSIYKPDYKFILYISDLRDDNNEINREIIINYFLEKGYQINYQMNVYDYSSLQLLKLNDH